MTETEWLASTDIAWMVDRLRSLTGWRYDKDRRWRAWVTACREKEMSINPSLKAPYNGHNLLDPSGLAHAVEAWGMIGGTAVGDEEIQVCALLRDTVGSPLDYWTSCHCEPETNYAPCEHCWVWREWGSGQPLLLAHCLVKEPALGGVLDPVGVLALADALEEGGFPDGHTALAHLRSGDEHVAGCWVVDSLLGRM